MRSISKIMWRKLRVKFILLRKSYKSKFWQQSNLQKKNSKTLVTVCKNLKKSYQLRRKIQNKFKNSKMRFLRTWYWNLEAKYPERKLVRLLQEEYPQKDQELQKFTKVLTKILKSLILKLSSNHFASQ